MAAAGDIYERELKGLLSGDRKAITKMIKTCSEEETRSYNLMLEDPFLVIRAAGSLGVDLVALRWDYSFPIEVKSSAEETMHFSRNPRLTEQAANMKEVCCRSSLLPVYAFRLKSVRGDPWRIFTIPTRNELKGKNESLRERIPKMEVTGNGNYVMRWGDGMKLCDLMSYMSDGNVPEEPDGVVSGGTPEEIYEE
ncbi:MAG: Holliday junction resolvase [Methanomassiliicoccaceae archaeon]|nr:Holliday junction resolvase [Methanomassiliicoccaceae archaeon]MCL2145701.1 Holliday junction resolvase [Methanomassiliicoccaceae archaeon]